MNLFGAPTDSVEAHPLPQAETPPLQSPDATPPAPPAEAEVPGISAMPGKAQDSTTAVEQLLDRHRDDPEQIRDLLVQGDADGAEHRVQALSLAAADAGATAVHRAADELARAICEQADPDILEALWAEVQQTLRNLEAEPASAPVPQPKPPPPTRSLPPPPPLDPAALREAVALMLPLLTDHDPGARDCLKANRTTFRSAFAPEAFVAFEHSVKHRNYEAALEALKKAARRHGVA